MKRHLIHALSLVAATIGIAACSSKVTPAGPANPQTAQVPADNVQGPSLDGEWLSSCSPQMILSGDSFVDGAVIIRMTIAGRNVTRVTQTFTDKTCATGSKSVEQKGTFRYLEKADANDYRVEYRFDIGNGAFSLPQEVIRLEAAELYISNFNVSPNIKLTQIASAPGQAGRNPYELVAGSTCRASWNAKSTRYAVCSNQGSYSFLDFGNSDWNQLRDVKVEMKNVRGEVVATYRASATTGRVESLADLTFVADRGRSIEMSGVRLNSSGGSRPTFGYVVINGNSGDCRPLVTGNPAICHEDFRRAGRYSDTIPVAMFSFSEGSVIKVDDCNLKSKTRNAESAIATFQVEGTAPCRISGTTVNAGAEVRFNLQDPRNFPFLAVTTP